MTDVSPVADETPISVVVFGGSGDLALKKTFPALFALHCHKLLPNNAHIVAYARSAFTDGAVRCALGTAALAWGLPLSRDRCTTA
jgi:glucose-6-phosphate 1-dehydrogenase